MRNLKLETLLDEKKIQKRVLEIGKSISEIGKKEPLTLLCILKGSFVFFSDLIRSIDGDIRCEFLGLSSYGDDVKTSGEVKLTLDLTSSIQGRTVVVVEDIVDTGLTMNYLLKMLEARAPKRILCCALLLKPEALQTKVKLDFVGFEIGKEFVVGYGLDYQGYYRNLPYIAQVASLN